MNIVNKIKTETINYPSKLAVIDGNKQISYNDMFVAMDKVANELRTCGIKSGDRVALLYKDSIDYIVITLAILSLDAVVVPVFPALSEIEVNAIAERIDVNYLISEREIDLAGSSRSVFHDCINENNVFIYNRLSNKPLPAEFYPLNPAFIRFSSGTTGESKGIVLSHETIIQRTNAANKGLHITSSDVIIWVLSMTFHFIVTIFLFLRNAATIILCSNAFPEGLISGLINHKATFIYASPLHYYMLLRTNTFSADLLSNTRLAISTAMGLPDDMAYDFHKKFGFELNQAYGIIEIGLPFVNTSGDKSKRGSVGMILPDYEMRVLNPDKNGVGEICLKGKGMFDAYFSPWQTRKQLSPSGWFNTGDLGRLDEDGFLFLSGRTKNVINYCGMKIFPHEIEAVLNQHPVVKESLVFGVTHPQYGQIPAAKIVLREEGEGKFNSKEMGKFCYKHLSPYKVPKEFHCVSNLDKTQSGKIKRPSASSIE